MILQRKVAVSKHCMIRWNVHKSNKILLKINKLTHFFEVRFIKKNITNETLLKGDINFLTQEVDAGGYLVWKDEFVQIYVVLIDNVIDEIFIMINKDFFIHLIP